MIAPIFTGRMSDDGRITLDRPLAYDIYKREFLSGAAIELILRKRKTQRTTPQNAYYWAVVVRILAEFCGYTSEEMHEALKWHFLRREEPGKPLPTIRSTTDLSTQEFTEYIEAVRQWAQVEHQVYIPLPNEVEIH